MFCKKCGEKIDDDSLFCVNCGAKVELADEKAEDKPVFNQSELKANDSTYNQINNDVASATVPTDNSKSAPVTKLKGYSNTETCTCLECGYSGLMGVVGYKYSKGIRYGAPVLIFVISSVICYVLKNMIIGITGGFDTISNIINTWAPFVTAVSSYFSFSKPKILYCPNCEKNITTK